MIEAVRWAQGEHSLLDVDAPLEVAAELVAIPGVDSLALHLINYGVQRYPVLENVWSAHFSRPTQEKRVVDNITVKLQIPDGKTVRQVLLLSPDQGKEEQVLAHEAVGGTLQFVVPQLDTYCLTVIQLESK